MLTEFTESEGESGLDGGLGEILLLEGEISDGHDIVGDDTFEGSGAVLNLELGAVGLVGAGLFGVVLGVEEAGDGGAAGGGDPEIRGSGVEDDFEGLRRGTEGDLGEVLSVEVICRTVSAGILCGVMVCSLVRGTEWPEERSWSCWVEYSLPAWYARWPRYFSWRYSVWSAMWVSVECGAILCSFILHRSSGGQPRHSRDAQRRAYRWTPASTPERESSAVVSKVE